MFGGLQAQTLLSVPENNAEKLRKAMGKIEMADWSPSQLIASLGEDEEQNDVADLALP